MTATASISTSNITTTQTSGDQEKPKLKTFLLSHAQNDVQGFVSKNYQIKVDEGIYEIPNIGNFKVIKHHKNNSISLRLELNENSMFAMNPQLSSGWQPRSKQKIAFPTLFHDKKLYFFDTTTQSFVGLLRLNTRTTPNTLEVQLPQNDRIIHSIQPRSQSSPADLHKVPNNGTESTTINFTNIETDLQATPFIYTYDQNLHPSQNPETMTITNSFLDFTIQKGKSNSGGTNRLQVSMTIPGYIALVRESQIKSQSGYACKTREDNQTVGVTLTHGDPLYLLDARNGKLHGYILKNKIDKSSFRLCFPENTNIRKS